MNKKLNLKPLVGFITDFGLQDSYVAETHVSFNKFCRDVTPLDITHLVPRGDVAAGSYLLWRVVRISPPSSVFMAVVDPGVGTDRQAVVIRNDGNIFIGPDNGIFSRCLNWDQIIEVRVLKPESGSSNTFQGRDLFASLAGKMVAGQEFESTGEPGRLKQTKPFETATVTSSGLQGKIVYLDRYGNLATNIPNRTSGSLYVRDIQLSLAVTYGLAIPGKPFWLEGSDGYIEIAVNLGSAADVLGLSINDEVRYKSD